MTWTFVIPRCLPSRNERSRKHHWAIRKALLAWERDLLVFKQKLGIPDAAGPRRVHITRLMGKGQKTFDPRNLDDKTLVDAMKPSRLHRTKTKVSRIPGAGLLVDDSARWATITVDQERAADGRPGTRITIEDIDTRATVPAEEQG